MSLGQVAIFRRYPILIHLSLLVTAMIWGGTFVAIKYLLERVGTPGVVFLRAVPAAGCFALILALGWRAFPAVPGPVWRRLGVLAVCGGVVNNLALAYGQPYIAAALASLIATSNPIFTAIISRALLGEPLTRRKLAGIGVALAGFLIVLFYGSGGASFSVDNAVGVLIVMLAPLGWAVYTVLSKPLLTEYEPHVVAGITSIMSAVILAPYFLLNLGMFPEVVQLSARGWLATIAMSVLAIFVAYILWYRGLRRLEPTQVAVYLYLVPFFGVLWAWLFLSERITAWLLLGGATILAGVMLTNSGRRVAAQPTQEPVVDEAVSAARR